MRPDRRDVRRPGGRGRPRRRGLRRPAAPVRRARCRRRSPGSATRPRATPRPGCPATRPTRATCPPGCSFAPALPAGASTTAHAAEPRAASTSRPGRPAACIRVGAMTRDRRRTGRCWRRAASRVEFTHPRRARWPAPLDGVDLRGRGRRDRRAGGGVGLGQDHAGPHADGPRAAQPRARCCSTASRSTARPAGLRGLPPPGPDGAPGPGRGAQPAAHRLRVGRRGHPAAPAGRAPTRRAAPRPSWSRPPCRRPGCGRPSGCSCATPTSCPAASGSGC